MTEQISLAGKSIVVSGGTQGVGAAVVRAACAAGASVTFTGRRREVGEKLRDELIAGGAQAEFVVADVADPAQAGASVEAAVTRFGHVDGLCNAAGLTTRGTLLDTSPELFDEHIAINLRGPFFTMQAAVKQMIGQGTGGSIVNIISISEHAGQPYLAPYVSAKAGLAGLTRNAAYAHRFDRIRINGVNIGWTETEGETQIQKRFHDADDDWAAQAAERLPMGRLNQPDDTARFVVFLLSDQCGVVTGSVIDWDQYVVGAHD
ncbi:SDR family oxidoreductase [Gordonia amarae]|uniref:SDR family oxidoreductase n=2 Tax=Gordonia amarae TaxID=36821 RepID=A0A857KM38_9ACTN|nr:SDR family oxidoreductase [Gordonia amarae]MCS3880013.1 NAD(P)-dependent dehydrogenase (short-subunit alcohol dehydrogenase family) [Gordonia amarae]QHN18396.1 SDR family oxidoreductase [Gordonia amarae]QHN22878.1 SDR family oxidoreductase [Gordonia amarae]QHN31781.1 SDR family oxidoreductase [Gordonia amarae]QHN40527.1 SDR family oxidoreductase [Gordonia amarae]